MSSSSNSQEEAPSNVSVLLELCSNNSNFFATDTSENGQRLHISFESIIESMGNITPKMSRIEGKVHRFDLDDDTPGNGYRSFLMVANSAIDAGTQLAKKVCLKRGSAFFRKTQFAKEMEACAHLISSLDTCLKHLETMLSWDTSGSLFPYDENRAREMLSNYDDINQYCFYGRAMGFQFCESLKHILQFISLSMAIFSEIYYNQGSFIAKATTSVMATSKYVNDPEQRSRRIVNICQNCSVDFCKAFWCLSESEIMSNMPLSNIVSPNVSVSRSFKIETTEMSLNVNGCEVSIPIPDSYLGRKPIQVRLISYNRHEGMIGEADNSKCVPSSRGLIFHCHGGGFIAQSSLSHESYLRQWAKELKVPILSIDYSLAPEAPFPRALEEVFYAYCWALKNPELLGTTGEKIVLAGDSAGGNLILATTLKCVTLGVPPPQGLFAAYTPCLVNVDPSPSRLLSIMDPLLPFGFLIRCLQAYTSPRKITPTCDQASDTESFEEISESDLLELQAHKSPVSDNSDTLTYGSLNSQEDRPEHNPKYVADLLEKYVLDSDTETDGTRVPVLKIESGVSSQSIDDSLQQKVSNFVTGLKWRFNNWMTPQNVTVPECVDLEQPKGLFEDFTFCIPKDSFISPLLAERRHLAKFPPTRIVSTHLDPCLDDCVSFAKKLKEEKCDVKLDILPGLPHGFLNFTLVSKDAYEGCLKCIKNISELLNFSDLPPQ